MGSAFSTNLSLLRLAVSSRLPRRAIERPSLPSPGQMPSTRCSMQQLSPSAMQCAHLDHAGVGQGGGVAQLVLLKGSNLAQHCG